MEMEVDRNFNEGDAQGSSSQSEFAPPELPHPEPDIVTDSQDLELPNRNDIGSNDDIEEESSLSPAQSMGTPATTEKVKRKVARFNKEEFAVLQREATITFNPPMSVKKQLAEDLNIDLKRVTGFFNNARSGNYAFARAIKEKQNTTAIDNNESVTSTPTPSGLPRGDGTPDFAPTSTKRKRQPTKKAREGDGSVKRASRSPAITEAMVVDSDDDVGPTTTRSKERGSMKVTSRAVPTNEGGFAKANLSAGFTKKTSHPKSKSAGSASRKSGPVSNASAATINEHSHPDQLLAGEGDDEGEGDGASSAVKPGSSMPNSTSDPGSNRALNILARHAAADAHDPGSKSLIMVTRTAGQRPSNIPIVPYDPERAKRAADEAVNEARGLMRPEERERADKNNRIPHRPHVSASPANNREALNTPSNSQSWEERRAKLQAEVKTQWNEREDVKQKMIDLKKQYNEGNAKLQLLSDKYKAPDCPGEAKVAMSKEFDIITVQLQKIQKEYSAMTLQIEELKKSIEARNSDIEKLRGPRY